MPVGRLLIPRGTCPSQAEGSRPDGGLDRLRLLGVGFLGMGFLRESKADGVPRLRISRSEAGRPAWYQRCAEAR